MRNTHVRSICFLLLAGTTAGIFRLGLNHAAETPAIGLDHTFGAALSNVHLGSDGVRRIEKIRRVSMRDASHRFAGVGEGGPACR